MRYLLIDANHLASRCRHAGTGQSLTTSEGKRSGVVYGVVRGVSWAKRRVRVDDNRVICFWDAGRATGRMELYPEYKAGRQVEDPTEEELLERKEYYQQIDAAIEGLGYAGIRQVRVTGTEADDLISIYSRFYQKQGHEVVIYSGDYDLHQLSSPTTKILHSGRKLPELLEMSDVLSFWDLPFVHLIPVHKSLVGDTSDAIKGVPGIGKKRACQVAVYPHLILSNCERPEGIDEKVWRLIEKVRHHQDVVIRNLKLMLLPSTWQSSFYDERQAKKAIDQVLGLGLKRSMTNFLNFCRRWELVSILENIHYW